MNLISVFRLIVSSLYIQMHSLELSALRRNQTSPIPNLIPEHKPSHSYNRHSDQTRDGRLREQPGVRRITEKPGVGRSRDQPGEGRIRGLSPEYPSKPRSRTIERYPAGTWFKEDREAEGHDKNKDRDEGGRRRINEGEGGARRDHGKSTRVSEIF